MSVETSVNAGGEKAEGQVYHLTGGNKRSFDGKLKGESSEAEVEMDKTAPVLGISYEPDADGRSCDPAVMAENIRLPLKSVLDKSQKKNGHIRDSCRDVVWLTISPGFLKRMLNLNDSALEKLVKVLREEGSAPPGFLRNRSRAITNEIQVPIQVKTMSSRSLLKMSIRPGVQKKPKKPKLQKKRKSKRKSDPGPGASPAMPLVNNLDIPVTKYNLRIDHSSVQSLKPGGYVNDVALDYGILKALEMSPTVPGVAYLYSDRWPMYFFKPDYPASSVRVTYKSLQRSAPQGNLLNIKHLIIPVCRQKHWFLVIVCNPFPSEEDVNTCLNDVKKYPGRDLKGYSEWLYRNWLGFDDSPCLPPRFLVLDSMSERMRNRQIDYEGFHVDSLGYIKKGLIWIHQEIWAKRGLGFIINKRTLETALEHRIINLPSQPNSEDCGVYCMKYVQTWFSSLARCQGNYMALLERDNLNAEFERFGGTITRKYLCREILNECRKHCPQFANCLEQTISKLFK